MGKCDFFAICSPKFSFFVNLFPEKKNFWQNVLSSKYFYKLARICWKNNDIQHKVTFLGKGYGTNSGGVIHEYPGAHCPTSLLE